MSMELKLWPALLLASLLLLPVFTPAALAAVRITGFTDFTFGTWSGSGDLVLYDGSLCVYDSGGGQYKITITGSGSGGAYTIASGANTLAYTVGFKASSGTGGTFTAMTSGTRKNFTPPNTASETCGGVYNAALRLTFAAASLSAAVPGSYSGSVTVLLEP